MERILIIDDDVALCEMLTERLEQDEFVIETVHDGVRGLERARSGEHALVVLDLMLPGINGISVLRQLRQQSDLPVLILTAKGEDVERILGLEIGADDYLPKPFNPRELVARIRAILRRSLRTSGDERPIFAGDLELRTASREVFLAARPLLLTSVEFTLLETLVKDAGRIISRERLTEIVLGRELRPFDRVIDVHVSNLRRKLGNERIKTVRGAGYLYVVRAAVRHGEL
ncbi:MAG: DNA-binding response regulator [Proteobacteria bacterium]|nr:MAG: DNA-binding response regulator [Pseudomonadota bacterium]